MSSSVTVTTDRLRSDLHGMARAAHRLEHVLGLQARRTAEAIDDVPRGSTSRLRKGIVSAQNRKVTNSSFEIGPGTFYGHMLFRGTSHSRPEPPNIPNDVGRETARLIGEFIVQHRHGAA
jgi:hypothetical protein